MFGRRSASFRAANLTRAALSPITVRHGIDYGESGFTAPASEEELGFEALRSWRTGSSPAHTGPT
jgi:hypothetical protein